MQSAICPGWLSHARLRPRPHAFRYRLFMLWLDLAELDQVFRGRWLWSAQRAALARFDRRDHLGDPSVALDESVRRLVESRTGQRPTGPIRLLTHLRYFGHVFNPVSFYFCFDGSGARVDTVVAEVNNTPWGEQHCYVLRRPAGADNCWSARSAKAMHVSPFMPMDLDYEWRFALVDGRIDVQMTLHPDAGFHAQLALRRMPISTASLARVLLRFPLMTLQVIAAIHWQALLLWLKRVPVHTHPAKAFKPSVPPT